MQKAEAERLAAERALQFAKNEAERREKEAELLALQNKEKERLRLMRENEDKRLREEAERKINEEKLQFELEKRSKIKEIKDMAETVVNIKIEGREKNLEILIQIYNALNKIVDKNALTAYLDSDIYKQNIQNITKFIALRPITYGVFKSKTENQNKTVNLSHIFKFKDAFTAKSDEQKKDIVKVINAQVGGGGNIGDNFSKLVNNILLDNEELKNLNDSNQNEVAIKNEAELTTNLNTVNTAITQVLSSPDIIQDFYEILLGAARVFVNMKPLNKNNNAPTKVNKFNIDGSQGTAVAEGGGILQKGGYNYSDVISIEGDKYVKIGDLCSKNLNLDEDKKTFGPFAAIYPPQYNNSHIYGSMFGSQPLNALYGDITLDTKMKFSPESFDLKNAVDTKKIIPSGSENLNSNVNLQYQELMKKLARDGNVIIFGYGFSGSGKTYLLIEGSPDPTFYDPSILEQFISRNTANIASVEFLEIYPYGKGNYSEIKIDKTISAVHGPASRIEENRDIKIFCSSESLKENNTLFGENSIKNEIISEDTLKLYCSEINVSFDNYKNNTDLFKTIKDNLNFNYISKRIQLLERHRIHNLRILPTPNNDKSSRSFLQITINLKKTEGNPSGKLVLFDMPGTENTIRIKTEFITTDIFESLKTNIGSNISSDFSGDPKNPNAPKSKLYELKEALPYCDILTNSTKAGTIVSVNWKSNNINKKELYDDDNKNRIARIFKYFFMQRQEFHDIGIYFGNQSDIPLIEIGQEFAMFINGKDERFYDYKENNPIKFLNNDQFEKIVKHFIDNYLNKKNDNISMFWSKEINKYCKIEFNVTDNLSKEDYDKIFDIFGVRFNIQPNQDVFNISVPYFASRVNIENREVPKSPPSLITKNKIIDLTDFKYKFKELPVKNPKRGIQQDDPDYMLFNSKIPIVTKIYFSNPIIKYIYLILNYLFTIYFKSQANDTNKQKLHKIFPSSTGPGIFENLIFRGATFFIYKYIKYIVNQGKGIVTNLEHLKFFFLSRTYAINDYNKNCLFIQDGQTKNEKDEDKAFVFNQGLTDALINQPKYYRFNVKITDTVSLDETVNIGNMNQYKLLTVLQDLAGSVDTNSLLEKVSVGDKYTLDLLKPKAGNTKISIFIMMTNLKIFRDDTTDNIEISSLATSPEDVKNKISQVCIAEYDTLDFAQSISSTSIAKNALKQLEAKKTETPKDSDDTQQITNLKEQAKFKELFSQEAPAAVGGKRKFNMNQLLEHKNKKPRTHRNLSSKNKKSRVFYNRSKKNI